MQEFIDWISASAAGSWLHAILVAALILLVTFVAARLATRLISKVLSTDGVPLRSSSLLINIARIGVWAIGVSIMLGVLVYFAMVLRLRGVSREELRRFPMGGSLVRAADKFRLFPKNKVEAGNS